MKYSKSTNITITTSYNYQLSDFSCVLEKDTQTESAWKAWDDLHKQYKKYESDLERMSNEKETGEKEMKTKIDDLSQLGQQIYLEAPHFKRAKHSKAGSNEQDN